MDLSEASEQARSVRELYSRREVEHHGREWSGAEMMVGLNQDVGDLGRLVMAAEGRWAHGDDVRAELGYELAECLWWILAIGDRFDLDINGAYDGFIKERTRRLK